MMGRMLTERQVLRRLDIPDFRHMTKDKVIAFASMYDRIDPSVARKAIEQFPNFASTMRDSVSELAAAVDAGVGSDEALTRECIAACHGMLEVLGRTLEEDDLSFEQRAVVMGHMSSLVERMDEMRSAHQRLILRGWDRLAVVALGVAALAVIVLGGQGAIRLPGQSGGGRDGL